MAKHCTNCGHELRETDKFCAECGAPIGGVAAAQMQPIRWEYCEIKVTTEEFWDRVEGKFNHRWKYYATTVGPKGVVLVILKPEGGADGYYEPGGKQYGRYSDPALDSDNLEAVDRVIGLLMGKGWEPLPDKGSNWFSYKFRRPVQS